MKQTLQGSLLVLCQAGLSVPTGLVLALLLGLAMCALSGGAAQAPKVLSKQKCGYVIKIDKDVSLDLHSHNFTQFKDQHHYCVVKVTANRNLLIVLDLVYSPARPPATLTQPDCDSDYLHVGNDVGRVDVNLMTSYKFCANDVRHEIVSTGNHLWLAFKASHKPRELLLKVTAQAPVTCLSDQFPCSPVQCVPKSVLCDGVFDCRSGHDEFCHRVAVNQPDLPDPCFRCGDGTCIQPRLLRSDARFGRSLWYLCDGFEHCPDAWDEREDLCRKLERGRVGAVTECVPSDLQWGHNGSVLMWNSIRCDDNKDCFHGDDETDCDENEGSKLRADPATLGAVAAILFIAFVVIGTTYKLKMAMKKTSRPSTSSTVDTKCTQCTSGDSERQDAAVTERGCSEVCPALDEDVIADDGENSQTTPLRHTIV